MDFNLANNINNDKKKKENTIVTDEYDEDDEEYEDMEPSPNKNKGMKEQLNKYLFIIIGGVVIIFLIIMIFILLFNRSYTFEQIEEIMAQAAESYFSKYPASLPTGTGSVEISTIELANAGEMKPLEEYLPEGAMCSGVVHVQSTGTRYLYTPKLDCGNMYATIELYRKVEENNPTVSTGYGLYNKGGNKVFRGEVVNNYIQLDKTVWRIMRITSTGEMVLITEGYEANSLPWDDRYNQTVSYQAGINTYSASRIRESIARLYDLPEDSAEAEIFLSDADKSKLVQYNLCTGKRSGTEQGSDNASECREVLRDQIIGIPTVSDYMAASTDLNCKTATSAACQNYNYLVNGEEWWTITPIKENTYQAYTVDTDGDIEIKNVNNYANLRPVVHLNSRVLYKSGNGSKDDPYIIK